MGKERKKVFRRFFIFLLNAKHSSLAVIAVVFAVVAVVAVVVVDVDVTFTYTISF